MQKAQEMRDLRESRHRTFTKNDFSRPDESPDRMFYQKDRFVHHLDSVARYTVERLIGALVIREHPVILDLMAGWDSHLPATLHPSAVIGLGLNENELARNRSLTGALIHDLNETPSLPFPDETFDAVINTVSVDYMTVPAEIFREVGRILKPGGLFLVIFSNRMFPEKATRLWQEAGEQERVELVEGFFDAAGCFEASRTFSSMGKPRPRDDKYAHLGLPSDPIYAVYARKRGLGENEFAEPLPEISERELFAQNREQEETARGSSFRCPHCGQAMKKWAVPNHPFSDWDTDFMYGCFNDSCPYFVRGWQVMSRQGNLGHSYRLMYDPGRKSYLSMAVASYHALKDGIVEEDTPPSESGPSDADISQ